MVVVVVVGGGGGVVWCGVGGGGEGEEGECGRKSPWHNTVQYRVLYRTLH